MSPALGNLDVNAVSVSLLGFTLLPVLLGSAVKATIVVVLGWCASVGLRAAPAAARHWLWVLTMLALPLLPILAVILPAWRVLPAWRGIGRPVAVASPTCQLPPEASQPARRERLLPAETAAADQPQPTHDAPAASAPPATAIVGTSSATVPPAGTPLALPPQRSVSMPRQQADAWNVAVLIWATGAAIGLLMSAAGTLALYVFSRRALPVTDPATLRVAAAVLKELKIAKVRLIHRPEALPMTWGIFRPTVLLPTEALTWPREQLRAILLHELGHVRRRDCLAGWASRLALIIYWFHPLVWAASRKLAGAREEACDDLVLSHHVDAPAYAEQLVRLVTTTRRLGVSLAGVPVARRGDMESRVKCILNQRPRRGRLNVVPAVLLTFAVATVVVPLALAAARATQPTNAPAAAGARRVALRVVDPTNRPVAAATIHIGKPDWFYRAEVAAVVTANDGTASIEWAGDEPLTMTAVAAGYAVSTVGDVAASEDGTPIILQMDAGQSIAGVVRRTDGSPVVNALVRAEPAHPPLVAGDLATFSGATDASGRFRFDHAAAGLYQVSVIPHGNDALSIETQTVSLITGQAPPDLTLTARPAPVLRGRLVTTHPGAATSNVPVYVHQRAPAELYWQVATAADGTFAITGLSPASVGEIAFGNVGRYLPVVDWPTAPPSCRLDPATIHFCALHAGEYGGLTVHLYEPAKLVASVVDDTGKPFGKARVAIEPGHQAAVTDNDGTVSMSVPPATPIRVSLLDDPDWSDWRLGLERLVFGEGETVRRSFLLTRHAPLAPVGDGWIKGRVVDEAGHPVAGAMVLLEDRGLISNYAMGSRRGAAAARTWEGGGSEGVFVASKADGSFEFNLLSHGRGDIWADLSRRSFGSVPDVAVETTDVKITLHPADVAKAIFAGTMKNDDGSPAAGADVGLFGGQTGAPERAGRTKTDDAGHFELRATEPVVFDYVQNFWLVARTKQGRAAWRFVARCGEKALVLQVLPDAAATGRVLDERGRPVADAVVRLTNAVSADASAFAFQGPMAEFAPQVKTAADGTYTLHGLPPGGRVYLDVNHPGYRGGGDAFDTQELGSPVPAPVAGVAGQIIFSGETNPIYVHPGLAVPDLILLDGITLSGTARYPTGEPAAGASVMLSDGEIEWHATTDAQGRYLIDGPVHLDHYHYTTHITIRPVGAPGREAAYETSVDYPYRLCPGDHVTNVDYTLEPTIGARRAAWLKRHAPPAPSEYRAAVVESNESPAAGNDTIKLLNGDGAARWTFSGLQTKYWFRPNAVADPVDNSIYLMEGTEGMHSTTTDNMSGIEPDDPKRQLTKFAADGTVLWRRPQADITLLAVDPKTQNLWVRSGGTLPNAGDIRVLDREGKAIEQRHEKAMSLAFAVRGQGVWLINNKLVHLDRDGRVLTRSPFAFAIPEESGDPCVNDADGSVWVAERSDMQIPTAADRLWVVAADGRVIRKVETPGRTGAVTLDPPRGVAWQEVPTGIQRIMIADGNPVGDVVPMFGTVEVEPDTGCVWIAGSDAVARVTPDGQPIWFHAAPARRTLVLIKGN